MDKSYFNPNPRLKYCIDHSSDLAECQKKLMEKTLTHPESIMLGAIDVLQMGANLIKLVKGKKILDVGTFTGSSALAWALALPETGRVITMDVNDQDYLEYGKKIIDESGVAHKIDFRFQPALKTLDELIESGQSGTFDFAFIDADKTNYGNYYEKCLILLRSGGIIAVDNALWGGSVLEPEKDAKTQAIDDLNKRAKNDKRVNTTLLPTGDGLLLAFKK